MRWQFQLQGPQQQVHLWNLSKDSILYLWSVFSESTPNGLSAPAQMYFSVLHLLLYTVIIPWAVQYQVAFKPEWGYLTQQSRSVSAESYKAFLIYQNMNQHQDLQSCYCFFSLPVERNAVQEWPPNGRTTLFTLFVVFILLLNQRKYKVIEKSRIPEWLMVLEEDWEKKWSGFQSHN